MEKSWLNLENKTAVVTGAASGIGKAVVEEFLKVGANVIACDINEEQPMYNGNKENTKLLYVKADVSKEADVQNVANKGKAIFGNIDILVNNAGINIPCLLIDDKDENSKYQLNENIYTKVMDVNVKGVYLFSQIIGREMVKNGSGVIINMSSESGLEGSEGQSVYAATKSAVNSFTRSWSKELGKKGIRVAGIAPGILEETGLRTLAYEEALAYTRGITVDTLREGYSKTSTIPIGRAGKLTEVADLVCFLASEKASYIHGVTINIAGGKTRG